MKKTSLVLLSMLFVGLFVAAFALAESGSTTDSNVAVSADSVNAEAGATALSQDDLAVLDEQSTADVSSEWKQHPTFGAIVGQGYAIGSDNKGYFASIAGLRIKLVNSVTPDQTKIRTAAKLRIGDKNYRLAREDTSGDVAVGDSLTFDAYQEKTKVGTFSLAVSQKYTDMTLRTGTLTLATGESYQVTLATKTRLTGKPRAKQEMRGGDQATETDSTREKAMPAEKVRAEGETSLRAKAVKANTEVRKVSFWNRLFPKRAEATAQVDATATAQ